MEHVPVTLLMDKALHGNFLKAAELDRRAPEEIFHELVEAYVSTSIERIDPAMKGRISEAERARRESAIRFSRASLGLEGVKPSPEEEERAQRFINGEIDLDEYVQIQTIPQADGEHLS